MIRPIAPAQDVPGQAELRLVLGAFPEPHDQLEVLRERAWFAFHDAAIAFQNRGKGGHRQPWESYEELRTARYRTQHLWMNWLDLHHQCTAAGLPGMDPELMNDGYSEDSIDKLWKRTKPAAVRR